MFLEKNSFSVSGKVMLFSIKLSQRGPEVTPLVPS
jgi:hypothetical protein